MTAATQDVGVTVVEGGFEKFPVKASTKIYEGSMVGATSGYARGLVAGDVFLGHCDEQADNSAVAVDGYIDVKVRKPVYRLEVTITGVAITDIDKDVYASDDSTYTLTQGANTRVGRVVRYVSANTAVVEFVRGGADVVNHQHTTSTDGGPLTSPRVVTAIADTNGNELIKVTAAADAVNEITLANAATGGGPTVTATGDDDNVPITIAGKGTGAVILGQATSAGVQLAADQPILDSSGNELVKFVKTATAVNEITITNADTGNGPAIAATGETNVDLSIAAKGTGTLTLGQATGSVQIATVATDKVGFFGTSPVVQQSNIADFAGDGSTAVNAILDLLEAYGLMAAAG